MSTTMYIFFLRFVE